MKTVQNMTLVALISGVATLVGCAAATPPSELVNARVAYERASQGPGEKYDPAGVHAAKEQLGLAEAAFAENGDSQNTRDQAYLALRKAELAEIRGRTLRSTEDKEGIVSAMHDDQTSTVAATSAELERTKTQLAADAAELEDEKARRLDAEKRAAQAAADLAKFATVKQEARGMVITLSGSVLFASAKWDLLPAAQLKLNDVAKALIEADPDSKIVVEGHTDSQGGDAYNQDLSKRRAQAVRDYLVTRGIASDRILAEGFGPTRSIADNTSPEGRANNRRVEIVIPPAASPKSGG